GESFEDLFARTGEFLEEVVEPLLKQGKNVLIVGHGAMNGSIISRIQQIPLKDFWKYLTKNCELIRLM
ncbi:MAG: histidine phosphatase family protein, partial [Eubacterium sp.]